jgi:hypothetical protein
LTENHGAPLSAAEYTRKREFAATFASGPKEVVALALARRLPAVLPVFGLRLLAACKDDSSSPVSTPPSFQWIRGGAVFPVFCPFLHHSRFQ